MLHLVSRSIFPEALWPLLSAEDAVILLDDGVFAGLAVEAIPNDTSGRVLVCPCFILEEHLLLRGIEPSRFAFAIERIDYAGFVQLTLAHAVSHTWR